MITSKISVVKAMYVITLNAPIFSSSGDCRQPKSKLKDYNPASIC